MRSPAASRQPARRPVGSSMPGTVCGSTYRDTLDPLGHAFHDKASAVCAQAATCTEPAQYFVQCDRCDAVSDALTVTVGEALGHAYENGVCIRCGALMPVAPFEDVPDDAYYTDAVYWGRSLWNHERRRRQPLCSERDVTRAQIVTFLWNAAGNPEPESVSVPFTDVSADAYYYKALCWATENEITYGTSATTFSPNGIVTRSQAVALLWRVAGSPEASEGRDVYRRPGGRVLRGRGALGGSK